MGVLEKTVWYIEWKRTEQITLEDIANHCNISRFHLARVFSGLTGQSVMSYVRARRLTESARALANGADNILHVALDAGYSSHEAFTRAFRDQFDRTPEMVRTAQSIKNIKLVEPLLMDKSLIVELTPPRIVERESFHVAGLSSRYTFDTNQEIAELWTKFLPNVAHITDQVGAICYGVCSNGDPDGGFDYMAGVEVKSPNNAGDSLLRQTVPTQRYAVFTHSGHISDFRKTVYTIWNQWLPEADVSHTDGLDFELYDDRYDGKTGMGDVEIWLPIK